MRRFNSETAVAAVELQQMVADYWREVDLNGAAHAADYFAEDGVANMGPYSFTGRAGVANYYAERGAASRAQFAAVGGRRAYHTVLNLQIVFDGADRASLSFMTILYAGEGKLPALGATTPLSVGEVRWECRRAADGQWFIHEFHGAPLFLGDDDYVKKALKAV
jgi:hypothetical protein